MKIVTDIKEANDLLQSYRGSLIQLAFYNESLKRIAIRICLPDEDEEIYLVGVGCESINGRFSFSNSSLSIDQETHKKSNENLIRIYDETSGFELYTSGGFSVAQGLESEFGTSFDDFILDEK